MLGYYARIWTAILLDNRPWPWFMMGIASKQKIRKNSYVLVVPDTTTTPTLR